MHSAPACDGCAPERQHVTAVCQAGGDKGVASPFEGSIPAHIQRSLSSPDDRLLGTSGPRLGRRQSIQETRSVHAGQWEWGLLTQLAVSISHSACPVGLCPHHVQGRSPWQLSPSSLSWPNGRASMTSTGRARWADLILLGVLEWPAPALTL